MSGELSVIATVCEPAAGTELAKLADPPAAVVVVSRRPKRSSVHVPSRSFKRCNLAIGNG